MEQMPSSFADKPRVHAASDVHSGYADDDRPLELLRPREDDSRHVGSEFEQILECGFDSGEGSTMVAVDFLMECQLLSL
jgi:hypothetical protein